MKKIEETLAERGNRYGSFQHHARVAQGLQDCMREGTGWARLAVDQKQALTVIADKIARMLAGDPGYRDNWHDIVGYAKLVDDRMAADETKGCSLVELPVRLEKGYTLCPACKEVTTGKVGLENTCVQCGHKFELGMHEAFSEERMDVIGQNGNDGEHYEKPWLPHDGGPCPVQPGLKVEYKLRAGVLSDKPWPVEQLTWQHVGHGAPWDLVAYRLA